MLYESLSATLRLVQQGSAEYQAIQQYVSRSCKQGIKHAWAVDRHGEEKRFAEHSALNNRKLLWHGTNVAVVAAIIKSGLRIMPHSGGRVGRGIYLADMLEKSWGYTRGAPWRGQS